MKSTRLCRWCRYGRVVDRTHGDAELQEALAKESGAKVEFVRYLEQLRRGIIEQALRDGKKVFVNGIAAELVAHNHLMRVEANGEAHLDDILQKLVMTSAV